MKIFLLLGLLLAGSASADGLSIHVPETLAFYRCHVILAAADEPKGADWTFTSMAAGSHGGDSTVFAQGAHSIAVQVDKQWLTIRWTRNGSLVAAGQFVVGPDDKPSFKVGILFDPANDSDQVGVSCDRVTS